MMVKAVIQAPEVESLTQKMDAWHGRSRAVLVVCALLAFGLEVEANRAVEWQLVATFACALLTIWVGWFIRQKKAEASRPSIFFYHLGECLLLGVLMLVFPVFGGVGYVLMLLTTLRIGLRYGRFMLMMGMIVGFLVIASVFTRHSVFAEVNPIFSAGLVMAFLVIPAYMGLIISALSLSRDEAKRADEAKSRFLANTSHEFRTPLNSILGMADLLADSDLPTDARSYVDSIRSSATSLGNTVQEMLDFSVIEAGKVRVIPTVFSPREVLDDVVREYKLSAQEKGLEIKSQSGVGVPDFVVGDADHARRALANLMGNAIKFTHRGWVQIHLSSRARGDDKNLLCYRVTDSGTGFSTDIGEKLFNPFMQADNSLSRKSSGTGLGLAIARGYVEANNGEIGFKSTPGAGSEFWFTFEVLPAHADQVEDLIEQRALQHATVGKAARSLNVLVIDDQESNRVVFEAMLRRAGHTVRTVNGGQQAMESMSARWPDIALIDLHMPGTNGLDVLQWMRRTEAERAIPATPALVLSADGTQASRNNALAAGATGVLTKPLSMNDLIRHVSAAVTDEVLEGSEGPVIFSDSYLDDLQETIGNNDSFLDYLRAAKSDVQTALARLNEAINDRSVASAAHQLHTLKGLTASLGLPSISHSCGDLEQSILMQESIGDRDSAKAASLRIAAERALKEIDRRFLDDLA